MVRNHSIQVTRGIEIHQLLSADDPFNAVLVAHLRNELIHVFAPEALVAMSISSSLSATPVVVGPAVCQKKKRGEKKKKEEEERNRGRNENNTAAGCGDMKRKKNFIKIDGELLLFMLLLLLLLLFMLLLLLLLFMLLSVPVSFS